MIKTKYKLTTAKGLIIILLLLSCFIDIVSTIFPSQFISLESNLLFSLNNPTLTLFFMLIIKMALILYLCYLVYSEINVFKAEIYKFSLCFMIIVLIILQFYAGFNNISVKNSIFEDINKVRVSQDKEEYKSLNAVPLDEIKPYVNENAKGLYLKFIFTLYLYPLILAILSFLMFNSICKKKTI